MTNNSTSIVPDPNQSRSLILSASAGAKGLKAETVGILVNNLNPVAVSGAAGVSPRQVATDATLFIRVVDKSPSMGIFADVVRAAANTQVDAILASEAKGKVLVSTITFDSNSQLVQSFAKLENATRLDTVNYNPVTGMTAFYQAMLDALTATVAYVQSLRRSGGHPKVEVFAISDGIDNDSPLGAAAKLRDVIADLKNQEIYHFTFVAFGAHASTVAAQLDVPVLSAAATEHEIRDQFQTESQSVIGMSTGKVGGGFGN